MAMAGQGIPPPAALGMGPDLECPRPLPPRCPAVRAPQRLSLPPCSPRPMAELGAGPLPSCCSPQTSSPQPRWPDRAHRGCKGFRQGAGAGVHRQVAPGRSAHPDPRYGCRARPGGRAPQARRSWSTAATHLPTTCGGHEGSISVQPPGLPGTQGSGRVGPKPRGRVPRAPSLGWPPGPQSPVTGHSPLCSCHLHPWGTWARLKARVHIQGPKHERSGVSLADAGY